MPLVPGTKLGPYEVLAHIGVGGMGEVYRARDTRLGRDVAIKVLPAAMAENPQAEERFEREARAVSKLNHPNICTLFDVGDEGAIHSPCLCGTSRGTMLSCHGMIVAAANRFRRKSCRS